MTIDRAKALLQVPIDVGSGCNWNTAKLILAEVQKEHGMAVFDPLVKEKDMEKPFGIAPGTKL